MIPIQVSGRSYLITAIMVLIFTWKIDQTNSIWSLFFCLVFEPKLLHTQSIDVIDKVHIGGYQMAFEHNIVGIPCDLWGSQTVKPESFFD